MKQKSSSHKAKKGKKPVIVLEYGKEGKIRLGRKCSEYVYEICEKKGWTVQQAIDDFSRWIEKNIKEKGVKKFLKEMDK